jgi:hypothetical protein
MPRPKHNRTTVARNQSKNQRVKLVSISLLLDRPVPSLRPAQDFEPQAASPIAV